VCVALRKTIWLRCNRDVVCCKCAYVRHACTCPKWHLLPLLRIGSVSDPSLDGAEWYPLGARPGMVMARCRRHSRWHLRCEALGRRSDARLELPSVLKELHLTHDVVDNCIWLYASPRHCPAAANSCPFRRTQDPCRRIFTRRCLQPTASAFYTPHSGSKRTLRPLGRVEAVP
jgi:hypothetical protein